MSKPTIIFVPGFWEGPEVFASIRATLEHPHGYSTAVAPLISTGSSSPGNPSMADDIVSIRAVVESYVVSANKEVVLVTHSAGGFLGSNAIQKLGSRERAERGEKGGVIKIVFLAGAVWEEGFEHGPLPFFDFQGDRMYCKDPLALLFNDLPNDEARSWAGKLQCQPASGWDGKVTYGGWTQIPSVYLLCEQDAVLPLELQKKMAGLAGSEIENCAGGHMVPLSQPNKVVEVVRRAAGEVV